MCSLGRLRRDVAITAACVCNLAVFAPSPVEAVQSEAVIAPSAEVEPANSAAPPSAEAAKLPDDAVFVSSTGEAGSVAPVKPTDDGGTFPFPCVGKPQSGLSEQKTPTCAIALTTSAESQ